MIDGSGRVSIRHSRAHFMKTKSLFLVFLSTFIFCCGRQEPQSTKLGVVLPLTGDISEYGKRCKNGIDLAIEEINALGGVHGKMLAALYEDDKGVPKEGVAALLRILEDKKIQVVIGAVSSSVSLALVPIATERKVVLFSPASSSPKLSGASRYFFRNWPSDVLEGKEIAMFAFDSLGVKRVAILWVNSDYGLGLRGEFRKNFEARGGTITQDESYSQNATDFKTQLSKIVSSRPQAIYLAGYHREMAFATKQAMELGLRIQLLGDADYGVAELVDIAGKSAEGAIFATPAYEANESDSSMRSFAFKFETKYGNAPSVFEANAYDAVRIIVKVLSEGASSGDEIARAISRIQNYEGAAGRTSFDENNDVVRPTSIKIVKNGKFINFGR
jgi:branched-chain amino acid transport system substrate-binding protein